MTDVLDRLKAALSDRYTIERELGSGGMATVYLAQDLKLHREVALKVLRADLAAALGPDRFLQEIDIAAKLTHPHILGLHDCGEADGFLYYVMPYIEGESLRDKLAKEGELPVADAVRILHEIVDALAHAHEHGVVHRDIKPDNVMLSGRHALVTDFGVAKAVSEATGRQKLTTEGIALGTPAYMAPEQAAADPHIDHRADIYAVGAVAYELLTGRPPFTGITQQEILAAHVTQAVEPVTKYRDTVSPALAELVMRCLKKKPADRWQSAEELLPHLEALATPSGGMTPTGMMPVDHTARRRWITAGVAVGAAAVIGAIVVLAALPRGTGVRLSSDHVAVVSFRNSTGDPAKDLLGERIGHWITQGLQQAAIPVTLWDQSLESWAYIQAEAEAGRVRDQISAFAEETGAGIVVSGAIYISEDDSLEVQVNVADAIRGRSLGTVPPLRASRGSESEIIANTQQRVTAFLAPRFDEDLHDHVPLEAIGAAPSFEAYLAFKEGWRLHSEAGGGSEEAIEYFRRAWEADSTWASPLFRMRQALGNLGRIAERDSVVRLLEGLWNILTPYERAVLQYFQAVVDGEPEQQIAALRRATELGPGSVSAYNLARELYNQNRPREALDVLLTLDPERGWVKGWAPYWGYMNGALHMLGEHEEVLEAASRGCELHPDNEGLCQYEPALTLAALGRVEEVVDMFGDLDASSVNVAGSAAECLLGHGHTEAARQLLERVISWREERPDEERSTADHRNSYGWALFHYGRIEEARTVFDSLVDEDADNVGYRGTRGFFAGMAGDSAQARRDAEWLATLDRPYMRGGVTYLRGTIAGALGEREDAVRLLRQAFSEGQVRGWWLTWYSEFSPLRDYPPFQELMRPKG